MNKRIIIIIITTIMIIISFFPTNVFAQDNTLYGKRLVGKNGWLTPVASRHLTSTAKDHINRGSVSAVDITAPLGSAIFPIAAGVIDYAGCNNAGGYGCWVIVNHKNGFRSYYAHMINGSIRVKQGNTVTVNTILGQVGWTGMTSFGPHVHLEIHGPNGRVDPLSVWSSSAFQYNKLGNATSKEPVGSNGIIKITSTGEVKTVYSNGVRVEQALPGWIMVALVLFFLVYCLYSPKRAVLNGVYHGFAVAVVCVMFVILPALNIPTLSGSTVLAKDGMPSGNKWDAAYSITRKWEGQANAPCVRDPVLTRFGVTQGTYDGYRQTQGLTPKNVCTITQAEVKDIYYRRYWLASGANNLPLKLAITHFDFAINAGVGAAKIALAKSGGSAVAYNNYRVSFYQSARLCYLYCKAWMNRVADIRRYTE